MRPLACDVTLPFKSGGKQADMRRETMKVAAHLFAALALLLTAQTASAQSGYPNRPVKILVGFTAGTAPDLAARILADRLATVAAQFLAMTRTASSVALEGGEAQQA